MSKRIKPSIEIKGKKFIFDSKEEIAFYQWLLELKDAGYIESYVYQPEAIQLFPQTRYYWYLDKKTTPVLLSKHTYTADFKISFNPNISEIFSKEVILKYFYSVNNTFCAPQHLYDIYIDIKGSWNDYSMDRVLGLNRKWILDKHGIFINRVVPDELFADTFVPLGELYTPKQHKLREKYKDFKLLKDLIQ